MHRKVWAQLLRSRPGCNCSILKVSCIMHYHDNSRVKCNIEIYHIHHEITSFFSGGEAANRSGNNEKSNGHHHGNSNPHDHGEISVTKTFHVFRRLCGQRRNLCEFKISKSITPMFSGWMLHGHVNSMLPSPPPLLQVQLPRVVLIERSRYRGSHLLPPCDK